MSLGDVWHTLIQGLSLVSNAITALIKYFFSLFGFNVPDWAIQVATIIVLMLALWKASDKIGKVALVILVFLLVSTGASLLSGYATMA